MIPENGRVKVTDNSGARKARCIKILGHTGKRYAHVGDVIVVAIKESIPDSPIKKGEVARAVVVRTRKEIRRKDGTYLRFDDNSVVIIDDTGNPRGTRVFGPVARELRDSDYMKIISLATEVV